jgi:hypothetical protein
MRCIGPSRSYVNPNDDIVTKRVVSQLWSS